MDLTRHYRKAATGGKTAENEDLKQSVQLITLDLENEPDGSLPGGRIPLGSTAVAAKNKISGKNKKSERRYRELLEILLQEYLDALNDRIAALDVEIEKFYRELEIIAQKLQDWQEKIEAANRVKRQIEATGLAQLNEQGQLTDKLAEELLRDYERRTHRTVNRDDAQAVYAAILLQTTYGQQQDIPYLQRQRSNTEDNIRDLEEEKEELQQEIDRIHDAYQSGKTLSISNLSEGRLEALFQNASTSEELKQKLREMLKTTDAENQEAQHTISKTAQFHASSSGDGLSAEDFNDEQPPFWRPKP